MTTLTKILGTLEKSFRSVAEISKTLEDRLADLVDRHRALESERERIRNAPMAREDILAHVDAAIDQAQRDYIARLGEQMEAVGRDARNQGPDFRAALQRLDIGYYTSPQVLSERHGSSGANSAYHLSRVLFGLFGPQIKEAIRQAPYPEDTGLPAAEREKRIAEIDQELQAINHEAKELESRAREAGLDV